LDGAEIIAEVAASSGSEANKLFSHENTPPVEASCPLLEVCELPSLAIGCPAEYESPELNHKREVKRDKLDDGMFQKAM
jgi:hypothetical protein